MVIDICPTGKDTLPASKYGEIFVPGCTELKVKVQVHICRREVCLLPLAHNLHRRISQRDETFVEAKKQEGGNMDK